MAKRVTVYRLAIFTTGTRTVGSGKRTRTVPTGYGYFGWTADQSAEPARLPESGTFVYNGGIRVIVAARQYLTLPDVHQVQIRTNQDRKILIYNKQADGRISSYRALEE